jgi:hypothetical protein
MIQFYTYNCSIKMVVSDENTVSSGVPVLVGIVRIRLMHWLSCRHTGHGTSPLKRVSSRRAESSLGILSPLSSSSLGFTQSLLRHRIIWKEMGSSSLEVIPLTSSAVIGPHTSNGSLQSCIVVLMASSKKPTLECWLGSWYWTCTTQASRDT